MDLLLDQTHCINCGSTLAAPMEGAAPPERCPECGMDAAARDSARTRLLGALRFAMAGMGVWISLSLLNGGMRLVERAFLSNARVEEVGALYSVISAAAILLAIASAIGGIRTSRALGALPARSSTWRAVATLAIILPAASILGWIAYIVAVAQSPEGPAVVRGGGIPLILLLVSSAIPMASMIAFALAAATLLPESAAARVARVAALAAALFAAMSVAALVAWWLAPTAFAPGRPYEVIGFLNSLGFPAASIACGCVFLWRARSAGAAGGAPRDPAPVKAAGGTVSLSDAMDRGGVPIGALLGAIGVFSWTVYGTPQVTDKLTQVVTVPASAMPWLTLRWAITAAIVLAWVVPAFFVPNRRAARVWRWSAAATVAAALLLAGR